ncbi:hypothetical protein D3C81_1240750 [compost metagenome]
MTLCIAFVAVAGHEEGAVLHAVDGIEMMVKVGQRGALAGDIEQVALAAVQQEVPGIQRFDGIAERHRLFDVPTLGPRHGPFIAVRRPRLQPDAGHQCPDVVLRGAAGGKLAGLGAAVDFTQRAVEQRFRGGSQLAAERGRGAQQQVGGRHGHVRLHQRAQVYRRADQRARHGHRGQCAADVGRVERRRRRQRGAALQRQHDGGLEAEHMLRRHGADQGPCAPVAQAQPLRRGTRAPGHRAPGLAVRHRRAGRAGGEDVGQHAVGRDRRHHR